MTEQCAHFERSQAQTCLDAAVRKAGVRACSVCGECSFVSLDFARVYVCKHIQWTVLYVCFRCVLQGIVFCKHERLFVKILIVLVCACASPSFQALEHPTKMAFRCVKTTSYSCIVFKYVAFLLITFHSDIFLVFIKYVTVVWIRATFD